MCFNVNVNNIKKNINKIIFYKRDCQQRDLIVIQMEYTGSTLSMQGYERKISRLQVDNINLKQQLESMMFKMKTLEDVQIKYELLLGQSQNENQHLKLNQFLLQKKLQQQIQIIIEQKDQQCRQITKKLQQQHKNQILTFREKHKQQTQQQQQRYKELKQNYETIISKSSQIDVFSFKLKKYEKLNAQLQEQLETQRMLSEQSKQKQLLQQKNLLTKKLKLKYDAEIETYEHKLKQLTKRINQLELQNDILNQKNKNIQVSQQTSNIEKLKQILSQRKSIEKAQLTKLQQSLDRANNSMRKMVQEKYETQQKYISREDQMKKYIKEIQKELLEQEKSHTRQIFTLQQKMKAMKDEEINSLNEHIAAIKKQFQAEQKIWQNLSDSHTQQLNELQQSKTRQWTEYEQQKNRLKHKIKQLTKRLQEYEGKQIESQTQQMISSLRDIDDKQDNQTKYENGLVFLQRQLRKANMMIDQKNQQVSRLLKQQTQMREETQQEISQWRERYSQQKKQLMDRVFQLENQVRDLGDKIRLKDKQLQKSQKETSFEKIEFQKRIQSLQNINQQLKRDYERMVVANKAIEAEYRGERDRGVSAVGDVTYAKRMKWLELQKQKNELSIVFRQKEQQIKIIYETQIDQMRKERDSYKQKATLLEDQINTFKQLNDKLHANNKENSNNGGVSNKKKPGDMEKKIASLNLQIALTKNLFENLQKAKSRLKSRQLTERKQKMNEQNQQESD